VISEEILDDAEADQQRRNAESSGMSCANYSKDKPKKKDPNQKELCNTKLLNDKKKRSLEGEVP